MISISEISIMILVFDRFQNELLASANSIIYMFHLIVHCIAFPRSGQLHSKMGSPMEQLPRLVPSEIWHTYQYYNAGCPTHGGGATGAGFVIPISSPLMTDQNHYFVFASIVHNSWYEFMPIPLTCWRCQFHSYCLATWGLAYGRGLYLILQQALHAGCRQNI